MAQYNEKGGGGKKSKLFPVHVKKAYSGSRRIAPLILTVGTRRSGEWLTSHLDCFTPV